jgi:hypothetical protein
MTKLRDQAGQSLVMVVIFVAALLGMAALAVDVGSWFFADRKAQAAADAAALAGAQELPRANDATTVANNYAAINHGGLDSVSIAVATKDLANDTINVDVADTAPGFFARLFGLDSVGVSAHAQARMYLVYGADSVAPIIVSDEQPELQCYVGGGGPGCYSGTVTLTLMNLHTGNGRGNGNGGGGNQGGGGGGGNQGGGGGNQGGGGGNQGGSGDGAGQWGLLNLDRNNSGTNCNENNLEGWINGSLETGLLYPNQWYFGCPSAKFNSSQFIAAMQSRYYSTCGCEILLPIWDQAQGIQNGGSNAQFHIIGWVALRVFSYSANGSTATITGQFTEVIWDGVKGGPGQSTPNLGVRTISLTE